jgi:uncharacterized membrane protein YphA (DoxX/SURF4 family)
MNSYEIFKIILQFIIGLGIFNVWFLRFNKASKYRGNDAPNMEKEFEAYGLPKAMMYVVGGLKVLFAIGLMAGVYFEDLVRPSAIGIAVLMMGAILMHIRVQDEPIKSFPAFLIMGFSLLILFL